MTIYLYEEFATVREWWVEPDFRRRGVGKAMIELAPLCVLHLAPFSLVKASSLQRIAPGAC